jgi:hypothetical protein
VQHQGKGGIYPTALTSALDEVSDRHTPAMFHLLKEPPSTHYIGGLRAGLDTEAKEKSICLCHGSNPGLPVVRHYTD